MTLVFPQPTLEIEASNLLCVPVDAWPLVEGYALIVADKCKAKERVLQAAGRDADAQQLRELMTKLQSKLGVR